MNTITMNQLSNWSKLAPRGYLRELPPVGVGEPVVPVDLPRNSILRGDALTRLRELPDHSIDCVVTSPPYFLLRDYGVEGQIGLEVTVTEWINNLRPVFAELARCLKPGGGIWLNIGDTFSGSATSVNADPKQQRPLVENSNTLSLVPVCPRTAFDANIS